jgi:hypothetical protein
MLPHLAPQMSVQEARGLPDDNGHDYLLESGHHRILRDV